MRKTNKLPMISVLVPTGDQVLASGDFTTAGTNLNLLNGQLGVLSFDLNSTVKPTGKYLAAGDDAAEVAAIKVVQGTPASANTQLADIWGVGDPSHVESNVILRNAVRSVYVKKAKFATLGAQAVTTFPTIVNNGVYNSYLTLESVRMEKEYGITNSNSLYGSSPIVADYAGITNPLDYVLTNIMTDFNSQSKAVASNTRKGTQPFVVFGVKIAGGAGQALGTITPTTNITFQVTNGVNQVLSSSVELVQALARLVQDSTLTNTSTIEAVDITTAGAAAKIDALIVVGLPHTLAAYYDNVEQKMVFPRISLGGNFISGTSDPVVTTCYPEEGTGHTSKWKLWSNSRNQLNIHTMQNAPHGDWFSEGKSYIDLSKAFYTSYIIEHYAVESTLTFDIQSPKKTVLLFRCEPDAAFVVNVANVVTRIAAGSTPIPMLNSNDAGAGIISANTITGVEAILSAWLKSTKTLGYSDLTVGADATDATYIA